MTVERVRILGGGVGGLSMAHYFVKLNEFQDKVKYEVELFEKESELGGIARSRSNGDIHVEYCWHAFAIRYHLLLDILHDIGILDNLVQFNNFLYLGDKDNKYEEVVKPFIMQSNPLKLLEGFKGVYGEYPKLMELYNFAKLYIWINSICDERVESYSNTLWSSMTGNLGRFTRWLYEAPSIFFGMDYTNLSADMMISRIRQNAEASILKKYKEPINSTYFSLDGPMNEVFFNKWADYLRNKGVKIHLNSQIDRLFYYNNKIHHAFVSQDIICGDIWINALPPKVIGELYVGWEPKSLKIKKNLNELAKLGEQVQYQILFVLPKFRTNNISKKSGSILIHWETPWFLMTRLDGTFWSQEWSRRFDLENNELFAIGIGIWDKPGLNGKYAKACTIPELAEEVWNQLCANKYFADQYGLFNSNITYTVWPSLVWDEHLEELNTYEPKFSNSLGTRERRPVGRDKSIPNLYHATAYCKTSQNVYNMESATEAAAISINAIAGQPLVPIIPYQNPGLFWRVIRAIDRFLFKYF